MSYTPPKIYGNMFVTTNSTATNTSGGITVFKQGYSSGDASGTTLSTTNGTITINQTGEVRINFTGSVGNNGGGAGVVIDFYVYVNGAELTRARQGVVTNNESSTLAAIVLNTLYSATYGDIVDIRVNPVNGSDSTNRPIVNLANFSVQGI